MLNISCLRRCGLKIIQPQYCNNQWIHSCTGHLQDGYDRGSRGDIENAGSVNEKGSKENEDESIELQLSGSNVISSSMQADDEEEEVRLEGFEHIVQVPPGVYPIGIAAPPPYIRTPNMKLVENMLSWQHMRSRHKWSRRYRQLKQDFHLNISDWDSLPVKAVKHHVQMQQLEFHCSKNLQDKKAKVLLRETSHKRRTALKRLRELNAPVYFSTINKLGLKDDFIRMTFGMRYKPNVMNKYKGGEDPYAEDISEPEPTTVPKRKIKGKWDYKNVKLIRGIDY